jgi:glycosyltransferase involved in cell wall biosynthesis
MRFLRGLFAAIKLARRAGCRIVHINCFHCSITEQLMALFTRAAGMRLVITLHDIESFGNVGSTRGRWLLLKMAAAVIVLNGFSRDRLAAVMGHGGGPPVFVIPSGHYNGSFPPFGGRLRARANLSLPTDKTVFLFFGNSRMEKGLDLLLRAMGPLRDDNRVLLLVAGKMKPDQEKFYRGIIDAEKIGARVQMAVGHVSDEDVPSYYGAADLVVVPYRRIYDSAVTLMAMSLGRAVLASNLPPLVEVTANGAFGLLFPSEDVEYLTRMLRWATDHREVLDELGSKAKDYIVQERSWTRIGEQTAQVYRQIARQFGIRD